jgi:hypothetical protein
MTMQSRELRESLYLLCLRLLLPCVDGERYKLRVILNQVLYSESICILKLIICLHTPRHLLQTLTHFKGLLVKTL